MVVVRQAIVPVAQLPFCFVIENYRYHSDYRKATHIPIAYGNATKRCAAADCEIAVTSTIAMYNIEVEIQINRTFHRDLPCI